jgi:hypothetical protein
LKKTFSSDRHLISIYEESAYTYVKECWSMGAANSENDGKLKADI